MLLTLKPPIQNGIKGPHEYSIIRQSIPTPRTSSTSAPPRSPQSSPSSKPSPERVMEHTRRGLPPPSSLNLPPESTLPAMAPMGQLPPPPPQWHDSDESMRHWLQAKAEEDRRRQEEEKTRQETLKLEQRKIEHSMLRESFQAGVPPQMVPLIFAGLGGGPLARSSLDLAQQQIEHMSAQTQQQLQLPPPPHPPQASAAQPPSQSSGNPTHTAQQQPSHHHDRRDARSIPPNPYGAQATTTLPPPSQQHPVPPSPTQPPYGRNPPSLLHAMPTDPRPSQSSSLTRLNTGEMHIHHPPPNTGNAPPYASTDHSLPPPASSLKHESQAQQSPPIYFHHWQPPSQSQSNSPSSKAQQESGAASQSHSHLRSEYQESPGKKRKAQGPHQAPPPPSSLPSDQSTPVSHSSPRQTTPGRRLGSHGHTRAQSDATTGSHEFRYQNYQAATHESSHRYKEPSERDPAGSAPRRASAGAEPTVGHPGMEMDRHHSRERYVEAPPGPYGSYSRSQDSHSNR